MVHMLMLVSGYGAVRGNRKKKTSWCGTTRKPSCHFTCIVGDQTVSHTPAVIVEATWHAPLPPAFRGLEKNNTATILEQ